MAALKVPAVLSRQSVSLFDPFQTSSFSNCKITGKTHLKLSTLTKLQPSTSKVRFSVRANAATPGALSGAPGKGAEGKWLSDVVWPAAGAFAAMAAMAGVDKLLEPLGLTFTIAPFGAVCAVLFVTPKSPAAQKHNIIISHMACGLLGVVALAVFGPGWIARSVALASSIAFMLFTDSFHPPAAGLPILFIDAPKFHHLQWWYILFPSTVGCFLLFVLQEIVVFLRENVKF